MYLVPNYFLIAGSWNTPQLWVKANEIGRNSHMVHLFIAHHYPYGGTYDWVFTLIAKSVILLRKMSNSTIHNEITGPTCSILNLSTFCKKKVKVETIYYQIPFLSLNTGNTNKWNWHTGCFLFFINWIVGNLEIKIKQRVQTETSYMEWCQTVRGPDYKNTDR